MLMISKSYKGPKPTGSCTFSNAKRNLVPGFRAAMFKEKSDCSRTCNHGKNPPRHLPAMVDMLRNKI